jgi:ATP-binding cassette, subfamily B (MDR/TAP), member 1
MLVGLIGSLAAGCGTPLSFYIGISINTTILQPTNEEKLARGFDNLMYAVYLGLASIVTGCLMVALWVITGERQAAKCKKAYFEALITQETEFFDCNDQSGLNSQFTLDTGYFQSALG